MQRPNRIRFVSVIAVSFLAIPSCNLCACPPLMSSGTVLGYATDATEVPVTDVLISAFVPLPTSSGVELFEPGSDFTDSTGFYSLHFADVMVIDSVLVRAKPDIVSGLTVEEKGAVNSRWRQYYPDSVRVDFVLRPT